MIHHSQMLLQTQSLTTHLWPSLPLSKPTTITHFSPPKATPFRKSLFQTLKCSVSVASEPAHLELVRNKPFPAEVSRTIMELSSVATLSALTQDGWPLGVGVRFAVDPQGTPIVCLNASHSHFSIDRRSSLHVQVKSSSMYVYVFTSVVFSVKLVGNLQFSILSRWVVHWGFLFRWHYMFGLWERGLKDQETEKLNLNQITLYFSCFLLIVNLRYLVQSFISFQFVGKIQLYYFSILSGSWNVLVPGACLFLCFPFG